MSGNSKVIGVTMSRSRCEKHGAAATQLCDAWLQQTCGATVHWSVQSLCQSHQLCLSGAWNPDNLLYLYYLTVTDRRGMLHIKHFSDCLERIKSPDFVSACGSRGV